jgi:DNA-binding CsgD family transcriptional regulator
MNEPRQQLGEQGGDGSPLLERERELADLEALALATVAGHGSTVVIEGQPGLGKSRLLDQAATRVAAADAASILRFSCGELEQELAWSAVVGLLGGAVKRAQSTGQRFSAGAFAPAAALFEDPAQAAMSLEVDAFSVIHALYLLVAELSRGRPLLLLLDDAQWSDSESLQYLVYLQRRLAELPVGLVLATRPQAAIEQRDLLDRITGGPNARRHRLSALTVDSVTALVRGGPFPAAADGFCRACWQVTAGNPFYLHELLLGLREDRVDAGATAEQLLQILPNSVSRSVLVRLGRMPVANASALARAVAVLGDGTTLRHAAGLSGIPSDRAAEVADALAASELLAPGEPLRFVHPLVRSAVYADIPAGRRARLHSAAAAVLSAEGAAPEVVATHLLHVPLEASAETVAGLCAAAVAARKHGAPHAAARYLRRALEEPPAEPDRGELLVALAHAEAAIGDPLAVSHLEEALGRVAPHRRAEILLALGWAEHHAGRFAAAADAFQRGLDEVADDRSELAAELEAGYLGSATLDSARAADAVARIKLIEAAPAERQGPAHRSLLAQVLFARTTSGAPYRETVELAKRIWAGGRLLDEEGADSQTVWHVIGSLSWADAYAEAIEVTDAVLRAADARGSAQAHARGRYARAWPNFWTGRLAAAAADARAAIDIWYGGLETYLPAAIYWLVLAELERDHLGAAEQALALAEPVARWEGTGMAVFVAAAEGHLAAQRGEPALALGRHLRCGELAEELQLRNPSVMPWRSQAALAASLAGEDELARELTRDELKLARATGTPRAVGVALRCAGLVADEPDTRRLLAESVAVLEHSGATLEYARACVEHGAAIRRSGQRRAARPALTRGLELALAAGATSLAARAHTEIGAAGGRSGRPRGNGPAALTASERRIAELAADGHTNRYIASLLQVSVKAVEWHLHQCYRKLDIKTRRQLAGVLERS